jgi:hypothetical protein
MIHDCDVASAPRIRLTAWPSRELSELIDANDAVVCCTRVSGERGAVHAVVRQILGDATGAAIGSAAHTSIDARIDPLRPKVRLDVRNSVTHASPEKMDIAHTPNGKPYLTGRNSTHPLKFNLSHCGDLLVVALSRVSEIGVDVERIRAIPEWRRIADRVFDSATREQLFAEIACGADEREAFLRHWCRMEAAVKATGEGVFGRDARDGATDAAVGRAQPRVIDLPDLPLPAGDARYRSALALCP